MACWGKCSCDNGDDGHEEAADFERCSARSEHCWRLPVVVELVQPRRYLRHLYYDRAHLRRRSHLFERGHAATAAGRTAAGARVQLNRAHFGLTCAAKLINTAQQHITRTRTTQQTTNSHANGSPLPALPVRPVTFCASGACRAHPDHGFAPGAFVCSCCY
jgi:hypothetical protein